MTEYSLDVPVDLEVVRGQLTLSLKHTPESLDHQSPLQAENRLGRGPVCPSRFGLAHAQVDVLADVHREQLPVLLRRQLDSIFLRRYGTTLPSCGAIPSNIRRLITSLVPFSWALSIRHVALGCMASDPCCDS